VSTVPYDPRASYPIEDFDREYLRHGDTPYLAKIYQPEGNGPFPMMLAVHGGAWNNGDRMNAALLHRQIAASGMVVASIDFRLAPAHPYPAQVQDVHFAARWLKAHAAELNGDPETLGVWGGSSGGNTALLCALRPNDARYSALTSDETAGFDAMFRYVISCWGVLDPFVRYHFARTTPSAGEGFGGAESKLTQTLNYFRDEAGMHDGNPQEVLERNEAQALPPVLLIQGTEDMNIPLTLPQRFAPAYRALGGSCQVEWFPGQPHSFASNPGPESARAIALMQEFIAARVREPVPA